jgi:hypothetical protein
VAEGRGLSLDDVRDIIPDWVYWSEVEDLANQVEDAGGPVKWVNRRIVEYILGAIGAAVFGVINYIELFWTTITGAFVDAGQPVTAITTRLGVDVFAIVSGVHETVRGVAALGGPIAPVLVLGFYAVVFYLTYLVIRAAAPAATDALGSIPVIGSALDAVLTFMLRLWGGLTAYVGGDG